MIANQTLQVNEEESSIQRCPHDGENPYALVSRDLIRDSSISPECRWLVIYFLSMKDGWKINLKQLVFHLKPHMGRDKVYALVNEAIEAGYMKREDIKISLGRNKLTTEARYYISEKPKFKKSFRHPGFQDTDIQDPDNTDVKDIPYAKDNIAKEYKTPPTPPQKAKPDKGAGAPGVGVSKSSTSKKEKPEFSPKVLEVANEMLAIIVKYNPVYRPPQDLTKFLRAVADMIEVDKQDIKVLLTTFQWAVADNEQQGDFKGWQGIICTNNKAGKATNPAEIFKKHFSTVHSKMSSRPKRKFAASSDQNAAMEIMEEMNKRAL